MIRALRGRGPRVLALALGVVLVGVVAGSLLGGRRVALPAWLPGGEGRVSFRAVFSAAPSLTPGQGQRVTIAGVDVGDVTDVRVDDGRARVGFRLRAKYAAMVRENASALLRPRTGVDDGVLELDPGTSPSPKAPGGFTIAQSRTTPDVDPDELLASLDVDTRAALRLLLQATRGGVGSRGRSAALARAIRETGPVTRELRRVGEALDDRAVNTSRAVRSLRQVSDELADRRGDLARAVDTTKTAAGTIAAGRRELRTSLRELPTTLRTTRRALADSEGLATALRPATDALRPVADGLAPALRATRPFLQRTTPVLRDQLLPLTTRTPPIVRRLRRAVAATDAVTPDATTTLRELGVGANLLAYDPPGEEQGYLFWAQWLAHLAPWIFTTQDADGPIRRGQLLLTCDALGDLAGVGQVSPAASLVDGAFGQLARSGACPQVPGGATAGDTGPRTGGTGGR